MRPITEYQDYKLFLKELLAASPRRGLQASLAKAANCQGSYLSQVLGGKAHLSSDQAYAIAVRLDMPEVEREYLLLLVDLAKAATRPLQKRLQQKLETMRRRSREVVRFFPRETLPEEFAAEFYSSWAYNAVRMFLRRQKPCSSAQVAARFGLNAAFAEKVLLGLEKMGLAERNAAGWLRTKAPGFTLPWESPMYLVSHLNYRIKAVEENLRGNPSFNFSCTASLTEQGYKKVCSILESAIAEYSKVDDALDDDQRIYLLGIDFTKI